VKSFAVIDSVTCYVCVSATPYLRHPRHHSRKHYKGNVSPRAC